MTAPFKTRAGAVVSTGAGASGAIPLGDAGGKLDSSWFPFSLGVVQSGQMVFGSGDRINTITVGPKAIVPSTYAGQILSVQTNIVTNDGLAGSVVIDIRKCSYANFNATRPNAGDSITAGLPPTVSSALKSQNATLTGWGVSFVSGDVFLAYVVSRSANVVHAVVALRIEKSP